ncbi:MAG: isopenicillin N synthase family dioxygenase [Candidatus Nanopelagicales bacterium]
MTIEAAAFTEIPVLSFARWHGTPDERAAFARDLVTTAHEVGFLTLVDHELDPEFVGRYFQALQDFFALPVETKELIEKKLSRHFRGWERTGSELTDNKVDWREQLDLSTENEPYAADAVPAYLRLDGPNQWLPDDVLPGFRAIVQEFLARAARIADELMAALAVGLDVPEDTFAQAFGERRHSLAKLISYPPTPDGGAGVNAHHDAGFLTLLLQHGVGGLQALNPAGEWIDVPPVEGALVINIGETLQSMSGNYLVATTHRVISPAQRYSSAYFHGPDLRASLGPLDLDPRYAEAVAASPWHRDAGFMAKREELVAGQGGTSSTRAEAYGEQLWNYYRRSYPDVVALHYPDLA